jgi:hypothetical protein
MAKHPVVGRVKTRLARVLGDDRACALYRAFVLDLADRLARLPYPVTWAYWPATAPFATLLPGATVEPQNGKNLGARMAHAVDTALARGATAVVVIGADVPHVPAATLDDAVHALAGDADLVLGPAADGGYYLIGLRAPAPALFADIAWGTAEVLAITLDRAGRLGLRTTVLPSTFDIDEPADLERLQVVLARHGVDLPRTAALLATLGRP